MSDTEMTDSAAVPAPTQDAAAVAAPPTSAATSELDVAGYQTNEDPTKPRSPAITAIGVSDSGPNDLESNLDDPVVPYPQPAPVIAEETSPAAAPPRSAVSVVSGTTGRAESIDSAAPPDQPLDLKLYTASGRLRKKKGWKGYVVITYDSDGNEIEARPRDMTPTSTKDEHEPPRSAASPEQLGRGTRRAATQRPPKSPPKPKEKTRRPRVPKEPKEAKAKKASARPVERKRAVSELTLTSEEGVASLDDLSDIMDGSSRAPSPAPAPAPPPAPPKASKAATAPRSSLQAGHTRQRTNSPKLIVKLNASTSAPLSKGESTKGKPPAKRRKLSPASGRDTPQPTDDSRAGSSAPSRAGPAAKGKAKQPFPSFPTARQEAAAAAKAQEEATKRERAQLRETRRDVREANNMGTPPSWVLDVDRPLKKMPRAGMGDKDDFSDAPPIEESSARHEPVRAREMRREKELKDEALLIIQQSKEANERKEKQRQQAKANRQYKRNGHPPTPPPTGAPSSGMDIDDDSDGMSPGTPEAATTILVPTIQVVEEDFDTQFSKMMSYYAHPPIRHIMPTAPHDPAPPLFEAGRGPTVKLAPKNGRHGPRDKYDQDHVDGYAGLPVQFEREIKGFVDNVKGNVRQLTDYYFPASSHRRTAFTERLGRELTLFGLQMTNDGDTAIQDAPRLSASPEVQVNQ